MLAQQISHWRTKFMLARLRKKVWNAPPGSVVHWDSLTMRITDGPNFYMQYKDEFIQRIYDFQPLRDDPLIIDGGSNTGMSILFFKKKLPRARIIGFEPDATIFHMLEENLRRNGVTGVRLVSAGLGAETGVAMFTADGSAGGRVSNETGGLRVQIEKLSNYLTEPVDFLKLNIEGQELAVLRECEASSRLENVRELVLEYHGWAGGPQVLGEILNLLDRQRFRYLVHDFDAETCPMTKPPFRVREKANWFCLVYAKRIDL